MQLVLQLLIAYFLLHVLDRPLLALLVLLLELIERRGGQLDLLDLIVVDGVSLIEDPRRLVVDELVPDVGNVDLHVDVDVSNEHSEELHKGLAVEVHVADALGPEVGNELLAEQ